MVEQNTHKQILKSLALANKVMLVHPNKPPEDKRVNSLHIWCLPYRDIILIITFSPDDCQKKLLRAMTALKIQRAAPTCPLAMGEYIPFMIADTHYQEKGGTACNGCCSRCGKKEQTDNTKTQGLVPSFSNNETTSWALYTKSGWVTPAPKAKTPELARVS